MGLVAWLLVLLAVVGALYGRTVGHPFVVFDDLSKIAGNRLVTDPGSASVPDLLLTPTTVAPPHLKDSPCRNQMRSADLYPASRNRR